MAFVTYSDERDSWGYLYEAAFGTPNADNAAFKTIKFPKGVRVETGTTVTNLELNREARQPAATDLYVDDDSGPVRVTVPEFIITKDRLADLLYACLQNKVSEGAATAYAKIFKVNVGGPDFTADAGYFFTLAYKSPITAKDMLIHSCIVKEMTFTLDKSGTGDQNLAKVSLVILGKKLEINQTLTGTFVAQGTSRYSAHDFTYNYNDATAVPWQSFTIKLDNGAVAQDKDTDGTPMTWHLEWAGENSGTVDVVHWYTADTTGTTVDLIADRMAGTVRRNSITTSTAVGTDGGLKFDFYGKLKEDPNGNQNKLMMTPASYNLVHNTIATNDLLIVSMSDAIDQTP